MTCVRIEKTMFSAISTAPIFGNSIIDRMAGHMTEGIAAIGESQEDGAVRIMGAPPGRSASRADAYSA